MSAIPRFPFPRHDFPQLFNRLYLHLEKLYFVRGSETLEGKARPGPTMPVPQLHASLIALELPTFGLKSLLSRRFLRLPLLMFERAPSPNETWLAFLTWNMHGGVQGQVDQDVRGARLAVYRTAGQGCLHVPCKYLLNVGAGRL